MLKSQNEYRVQPADDQRRTRTEIDNIQLLTLSKLIPRERSTPLVRAALRIQEDFLDRSLLGKARFVGYVVRFLASCIKATLQRLWIDIITRWGPISAPKPDGSLRVAVHGAGS